MSKTKHMPEEMKQALEAAFKEAIHAVGMETFKKCSWFGSNHSDPDWVAESQAFLQQHPDVG